jgi:endonuclease/exonuclease/phosphatase family metal-dependent hydrolase
MMLMSGSATIAIIGYPRDKLAIRKRGGTIRTILCTLCLLMFVGCASGQSQQSQKFTVLTYNIHHGAGTDGKYDLGRLADVIKKSGADLVALQEVDRNTNRTKDDHPAELARLTGFHAAFGKAMNFGGGEYGDLVLSRYPIVKQEVHALPYTEGGKHEPRCLVVAHVETPKGTILFASTHLDHVGGQNDRLAQANKIIETLKDEKLPTIICGDFNCPPKSEPIQNMVKYWQDTTGEAPTCPSETPKNKIDYIFASGQFKSLENEVINDPVTSDHRPVRAVLEMK